MERTMTNLLAWTDRGMGAALTLCLVALLAAAVGFIAY